MTHESERNKFDIEEIGLEIYRGKYKPLRILSLLITFMFWLVLKVLFWRRKR